MATSKSYSDALKGSINTRKKTVLIMDINESYRFTEWTEFRNIGLEIIKHAQKLKLPLQLDKLTYGNGSCFMIATLQQCARNDVEIYLQEKIINMAKNLDTDEFRSEVSNFILNSSHPTVLAYKRRYEENDMKFMKKSWFQYWTDMKERGRNRWADGHFVQGSAYYLGIDIWIVATKSKENTPYVKIFGNLENPDTPSISPPIILGLKGDCHYQSLLPNHRDKIIPGNRSSYAEVASKGLKNQEMKINVKIQNEGKTSTFESKSRNPAEKVDKKDEKISKWTKVTSKNPKMQKEEEKKSTEPSFYQSLDKKDLSNEREKDDKIKRVPLIHSSSNESYKEKKKNPKKKQKVEINQKIRFQRGKIQTNDSSSDESIFIKDEMQVETKKYQKNEEGSPPQLTECPVCKKKFKQILKHLRQKESCYKNCRKETFQAFQQRSKAKISENKKKYQKIYQINEKNKDEEKFLKRLNKRQKKFQNNKRAKDYKIFAKEGADRIRKWRNLKKPGVLKQINKIQQKIKRKNESQNSRLKEFLKSTMHNAVFICVCCCQRFFKSNVLHFSSSVKSDLKERSPKILELCIDKSHVCKFDTFFPHEIWKAKYQDNQETFGKEYICLTCLKYLKKNKMPPICVKNNLEFHETFSEIKEQGLWLTELEAAMIARRIIFIKIFMLPISRWTAMTDKAVNIPIPETAINKTIELLPRTPKDAGLIGVSLKRKKEYENTHKSQLIDPKKIFDVLEKLKNHKNPHYQFYEDYSAFEKRCLKTDSKGYEYTFKNFENKDEIFEPLENMETVDSTLEDEILRLPDTDSDDEESIDDNKRDPARKFNFLYDESVCLTNKFPEINIAPGEGQRPQDILKDQDWDIQAFPHLHNPDGSNGMNQKRQVKLSNQQYFVNRICNLDTRFSLTPSYLYAAVSFIEKNQLQRNLNLAGTRGKKTVSSTGISYELQDGYRVLEGVKGTPKYHLTGKYEMLAKLDNFGAFQYFFTLSCADTRWMSNFAPMLLDLGYLLIYQIEENEEGSWEIKIKGKKNKDENWKDIETIIEEAHDSKHEMIRGNVVNATRYFQHRVKQFLSKIVMDKYNPMNVHLYCFKVEFQQRGAGMFQLF